MTYSCKNRKDTPKTVRVQAGWNEKMNERHMVRIPFAMSKDCQYQHDPLVGQHDPKCDGCVHKVNQPKETI